MFGRDRRQADVGITWPGKGPAGLDRVDGRHHGGEVASLDTFSTKRSCSFAMRGSSQTVVVAVTNASPIKSERVPQAASASIALLLASVSMKMGTVVITSEIAATVSLGKPLRLILVEASLRAAFDMIARVDQR
jgi:hypothetical protein